MRYGQSALKWGCFAFSVFYLVKAIGLPRGTPRLPGPGLYPLIVGIALTIVSLFIGLRSLHQQVPAESLLPAGRDLRRVLVLVGWMVFYVLTMPVLGHPLSSSFFFGGALREMGVMDWKWVCAGAFLAALISWYLFGVMLQVPLPLAPIMGL